MVKLLPSLDIASSSHGLGQSKVTSQRTDGLDRKTNRGVLHINIFYYKQTHTHTSPPTEGDRNDTDS